MVGTGQKKDQGSNYAVTQFEGDSLLFAFFIYLYAK